MKLIPLIDRTGIVRAWVDRSSGWICNLSGDAIALIEFDGVFKAQAIAEQIGWFDGVIRNRRGQVVLIQPNSVIDGLVMPRAQRLPKPRQLRLPSSPPSAASVVAAAN